MKPKNIRKIFDVMIDDLKSLGSLFRDKKPEELRNFSHCHIQIKQELSNLMVVWRRFIDEREELFELDLAQWQLFKKERNRLTKKEQKELDAIRKKMTVIEKKIRVDFLSLFLFFDIYLNKLIYLGQTVWGFKTRHAQYGSFTKFLRSLQRNKHKNKTLKTLYSMLGTDMNWIESTLGLYRDKFITHKRSHYQEWFGRRLFFPEIGIEHARYNFKDKKYIKKVNSMEKKLSFLIPQLKNEQSLRGKVYLMAKKLYLIENPILRAETEGIIMSIGIKSPDIYNLTRLIIKFSQDYIRYLKHLVKNNDAPYGMVVTEY